MIGLPYRQCQSWDRVWPVVHGTMYCDQNSFFASVALPPALSGFLSNYHFPRVKRQLHQSADEKGDNEMKPEAVHKHPGIYLMVDENPGIPHSKMPHQYNHGIIECISYHKLI